MWGGCITLVSMPCQDSASAAVSGSPHKALCAAKSSSQHRRESTFDHIPLSAAWARLTQMTFVGSRSQTERLSLRLWSAAAASEICACMPWR